LASNQIYHGSATHEKTLHPYLATDKENDMRWKLFTLLAVLALMVSTASPVKVKAQGLVEYALILVVVGIGENETAEIYWGQEFQPGGPQGQGSIKNAFLYKPNILIVTNTEDATCTQAINIAPRSTVFGVPIPPTAVSKEFGFVTLDHGEPIELTDGCFKELKSQRVVIQVGDRRFKLSDNNSPFSATVPVGVGRLKALWYSIYNSSTGKTVASSGKVTDSITFFDSEGNETN
jgi:hypothetical protein